MYILIFKGNEVEYMDENVPFLIKCIRPIQDVEINISGDSGIVRVYLCWNLLLYIFF